MTFETQEQVITTLRRFAHAYCERDLAGALSAFAPDAEILTSDEVVCRGANTQIRARLLAEFRSSRDVSILPLGIHISGSERLAAVTTDYKFRDRRMHEGHERCTYARFSARLRPIQGDWKIECARFVILEGPLWADSQLARSDSELG